VDHAITNGLSTKGTGVSVTIPAEGQEEFDPKRWARAFSLFNPHASVRISIFDSEIQQAESSDSEMMECYQPTEVFPVWKKFLPTMPTSAHWYSEDDFSALMFSHIADIRKGNSKDITLRDFVHQFSGLTHTAKAKLACSELPDVKRLSDCEALPRDEIKHLLGAMKSLCDPPTPKVLGVIGEDHFKSRFDEWYGVGRHWYKKVAGIIDGIPFVMEVFVAETTKGPGSVFTGVNFSPTFDDPFGSWELRSERIWTYGVRNFFKNAHVNTKNAAAAVHLTCPCLQFLDRGKSRLKDNKELGGHLRKALWKTCKTLYKEEERRKRDAARVDRYLRDLSKERFWSFKDAVFRVLPEAISAATGDGEYPVSARTLYYQVRPLIQGFTDKELDYTYFSQTLLTQYQEDRGPIELLYYDPRGILYEPHTGESIPLGTQAVADYDFPLWLYDKILYVEKKGLWPILKAARLAERFDMAVIAAEGYATEATRTLFEHADKEQGYQLFVLHDADPYGYNVARTLQEETRRMKGYSVNVIDLGLRIDEALEMGLQTEEFTRKNDISERLDLNEFEMEMFIGREVQRSSDKSSWVCRRVELNALSAPQLVQYIERKLVESGASGKVIPPKDRLPALASDVFGKQLTKEVYVIVADLLSVDGIIADLEKKFRPDLSEVHDWVGSELSVDDSLSWRSALQNIFENILTSRSRELWGEVRSKIADSVSSLHG
jgi:hypothetical protein